MMQLAPHPMALLDWIPSPGDLLGDLLLGFGWLLSCVPLGIGYFGYIVLAIWLTRWVLRHVQPIPLNPESPLFQQPGGWRPWMQLNWFQAILILGATEIGFIIPQAFANTIWRNPNTFATNDLGLIGRLAEIVGLICGFIIGSSCRYQLSLLMFIGMIGYFAIQVAHWVVGG